LPGHYFPGVTTCAAWCAAAAARLGDTLDDAVYYDLLLTRAFCALFAALRDGRETIGEP
jgi:hypothetical protein